MKIFITGAMSSQSQFNRPKFNYIAALLHEHTVLNPAILPDGLAHHEYMQICKVMLEIADAIYILDGWRQSDGSREEVLLAIARNKRIYLEGDLI